MSEGERISNHPGYRAIWRTVLKTQIKQLVEQLSYYGGEEAILLSASLNEGTLSHVGSESGEVFLSTHDQVKKLFLGFCLNRHKKPGPQRDKQDRQDSDEPSHAGTVRIGDKTVEGCTKDRTVIDAAHTQTSAEQEKHQTTKPHKDKTTDGHRQDSGEYSENRSETIDNARTQTSSEHKKHQTAKTDGSENIKEEHSYVAENESSTSSIEDLDDTSDSEFDSDEMLDDSDEEMLDDSDEEMLEGKNKIKNSTRKLHASAVGKNVTDIPENPDTSADKIKVLDKEDSGKGVCETIEMTCDEIPEDSDINLDKVADSETLVIVKDESDSDISVSEPQKGTSKDSTDDNSEKAAVGVYRNGKIRWATSDLEENNSRKPKRSLKRKYQHETGATQSHANSDLKEKYSRQPKPCTVKGKRHMSLISTKYHAIMEVEKGRKMVDVAREYKLRRPTLSGWVKFKDKIKALYLNEEYGPNRKKKITLKCPDVDRAMRDWVQDAKINSIPVPNVLMVEKANEFARDLGYTKEEFTCSNGWVERFKGRHGLNVKGRPKPPIPNKSGLMKKTEANNVDTDQKASEDIPRISCQHGLSG